MPISHISKFFAVKDAKIKKLLTDPAGGAATYGSLIDVPGIKGFTVTGTIETKKLRGDFTLLDSDTVLSDLAVSFRYAKLSLDAQVVMVGGAVADSGVTPNMKADWGLLGSDDLFPQWGFEGLIPRTDIPGGDAHVALYKCRLNAWPALGGTEDDYQTFETGADVVPRISDSKWMNVWMNETSAAIA